MNKDKLIPELRFPEFENEEEWENDELGNYCEITTGKLDANAMVENGQYRFYTCAKDYYFIDNYAFDTDALLISGNGAHVGYIHHYKGKFNAYQRTYVLDKFHKDIHFVQYYLERNLKGRIASEKKDGNTPYIVRSTLSEMELLSPKNEIEQQKIASCLSSLDELVSAYNEKLNTLKDHKKGLMQNLFPQEGQKVPNYRFPEFEKDGEWDNNRITELGETVNGLSGKKGADFGRGSLYVQYKQVFNKSFIDFSECRKVDVGIDENQNQLQLGDILFTTSSETPDEVGFASVITKQPEEPIYLNSFCFILRPNDLDGIKPSFSRYLFHSPIYRKSVSAIAQGSTRYNLSKGAFLKLIVPVPKPKEQKKIASCLSSVDELIIAQAEKIKQLQQHKKGLMQGLFPKIEN